VKSTIFTNCSIPEIPGLAALAKPAGILGLQSLMHSWYDIVCIWSNINRWHSNAFVQYSCPLLRAESQFRSSTVNSV